MAVFEMRVQSIVLAAEYRTHATAAAKKQQGYHRSHKIRGPLKMSKQTQPAVEPVAAIHCGAFLLRGALEKGCFPKQDQTGASRRPLQLLPHVRGVRPEAIS